MAVWKHASTTMAALSFCSVTVTWFLLQYIGESIMTRNAERKLKIQFRPSRELIKQLDVRNQTEWYPVEVVTWQVFVQSAIINHHLSNDTHNAVIITAWNYHRHDNPFFCCFPHNYDNVTRITATFMFRHNQGLLSAHQFACFVSKKMSLEKNVFFSINNCVDHVTRSLPIVYPERKAGKMAVCMTLYNDVNVDYLVEWFELQKLQGVHKIEVFHFQLTKNAKHVLEYYKQKQFVLMQPLVLPVGLAAPPRRGFLLDERPYENQFQADEQITVFDCIGRLSGYDYVGVYDIHEVVIPQQPNIKLPTFFHKLKKKEPEAGAFMFNIEEFITDWGRSINSSELSMTSYVYRMSPSRRNEKMIHLPGKLLWQDIHHIKLIEPYYVSFIEPSLATIHYYGKCRYKTVPDCATANRTEDRQLLRYENKLKLKVKLVKQNIEELFNNTTMFKHDKQ